MKSGILCAPGIVGDNLGQVALNAKKLADGPVSRILCRTQT